MPHVPLHRFTSLLILVGTMFAPMGVTMRTDHTPKTRLERNGKELEVPTRKRARRGSPGLHCCSVQEDYPMLLKCDKTPSDRITAVPFAVYGSEARLPVQDSICGRDFSPKHSSLVRVDDILRATCVGKRECVIHPGSLGDPCHGETKILTVRWECFSDSEYILSAGRPFPNLPLRVENNVITDRTGSRVRLKGVNWSGAHNIHFVPGGLDVSPLSDIVRHIRELGFNFVRLTFSTAMVLNNPTVENRKVAANPSLVGMRALEVFDEVVQALANEGLLILVDNHMHDNDWCCATDDCNGMWFNADYTTSDWVNSLANIAARYNNIPAVFAVGLKNEPRDINDLHQCRMSKFAASATETSLTYQWSAGPEELQYRSAMERAGAAVLQQNSHVFVSISGLDFSQHLEDVEFAPIRLPRGRFFYEAHEYAWYDDWEDAYTSGRTSVNPRQYYAKLTKQWGYLLKRGLAPVLVSEFGMSHEFREHHEGVWFDVWSRYVQAGGPLGDQGGLDWAYWQLGGVQQGGRGRTEGERESYGIMNQCWTGPFSDAHFEAVSSLMRAPA